MGDVRNLRRTAREILDLVPEDIDRAVVIYRGKNGRWGTGYNYQDTADLCFAEKVLHREIMRLIEQSAEVDDG